MLITFLQISQSQANNLANKPNEVYSPFRDQNTNKYYIFKDSYTSTELPNTVNLQDSYVDGLTPIDPTKPLFPRKK